MSLHHIPLSESLYHQLKALADRKGQTIEVFVQTTLKEIVSFEHDILSPLLAILPEPDVLLPPYGSPEEAFLRSQLATLLSNGPVLSQVIIEERGER